MECVFSSFLFLDSQTPHSTDSARHIMSYILVPNAKKVVLDRTPFLSRGLQIPAKLEQERKKAYSQLKKKPAETHDIWSLVCAMPEIVSADQMRAYVDTCFASQLTAKAGEYLGEDIPVHQLANWLSNHGQDWKIVLQDMFRRRDQARYAAQMGAAFSVFLDAALAEECICGGGLFRNMANGLLYAQEKAGRWSAWYTGYYS